MSEKGKVKGLSRPVKWFLLSWCTFWEISLSLHPPSPSSPHLCPPQSLWKRWLIEKCRQKNNVSTCCLAEVSISGTVNTAPPSIAKRLKTSHWSPNKCHRSWSALYFYGYGVQPSADRRKDNAVKMKELSLCGDILKMLVWLADCVELCPLSACKTPVLRLQRCQHC